MKKIIKRTAIAAALTILCVVLALSSGFAVIYAYISKNVDASLDFESLMSAKGLTSTIVYLDENGRERELVQLHGAENRIWTDIENVPDHVIDAFISIEDHRFFEHDGIDFKRTVGAVLNFAGNGGGFGGSTITQQLIKNLTGDDQNTIKRKIREILRAKELEKNVSKKDILEAYLNTVYLSNGCYGIKTAAEYFFSKDVSELSLPEGAALAAILKYPYKYDPIRNPEQNTQRRNTVLLRMYELGKISEDEYSSAISKPLELNTVKEKNATRNLSWFEETAIDEVADALCEKYKCDKKTAIKKIYSGGLKIVSTIKPDIQSALEKVYENEKNFPASGVLTPPESASVVIDPRTGALLAVVGSRGEKKSDRIMNYATQLTRSPGSVLKPLSVYAPALDKDIITWASVYDDVPVFFEQTDDGFTAWPKNNPRVYSGLTNVNHSIEKSINTVAVKVLRDLGTRESYEFLKKLGIRTLTDGTKSKDGKWLSDISEAPLALGATTNGCTLYQIAGAYTMLATDGTFRKPHCFTKVYDDKGELILENETGGERMISAESADIMTRMLENVVKNGTAKGMIISQNVSVAGKTGTSNSNTDRWFIGYTPDYICGVWYGYIDARDIGNFSKNPACTVFDSVMSEIYKLTPELLSNEFKKSKNVVSCLYCRDSGCLADADCILDPRGSRIELGYFKKGTEPQSHCDAHVCVEYDDGVICDGAFHFDSKKVALVKNYTRSFPCPVTVEDAQYTYRYLSPLYPPNTSADGAYFDSLAADGEYFGCSGVPKAFNRSKNQSTAIEDQHDE